MNVSYIMYVPPKSHLRFALALIWKSATERVKH